METIEIWRILLTNEQIRKEMNLLLTIGEKEQARICADEVLSRILRSIVVAEHLEEVLLR